MIEAEKSRATLLRELDAMRDGKSSMVKDLIQSRDESAEEAAILSRKWLYVYMKVVICIYESAEEATILSRKWLYRWWGLYRF